MSAKCKVVGGNKVKPCELLDKAYDLSPTKRSRGLFGLTLVNLKVRTEELLRDAFAIKSGEFVDRGIFIHYCPFCGENIETVMPEPKP